MSNTDLYYFYESDFNKGNMISFYNSSPNRKLQEIFEKAMGDWSFHERHPTYVVQGYRGHKPNGDSGDSEKLEESYGIQEIRFWWGISKHWNWIPVGGTVLWATVRAQSNTDWHSIYFDSDTGEALSHDINEAAAKLNDIGMNHLKNSRFDKAMSYFKNAYYHSTIKRCYDEYKENQSKVENERKAQKLCSEGQNLFEQGRFSDAEEKFREAYSISQVKNEYEKYEKHRKKATAEKEAEALFNRGKQAWNEAWDAESNERFDEAETKFQEALTLFSQASDLVSSKNSYKNWKTASSLKIEGNLLFNLGLRLQEEANQLRQRQNYEAAREKYREAGSKFQQALTSSGDSRFNDCIEIVVQCLNETREALNRLNTEGNAAVFADLSTEVQSSHHEITAEKGVEREVVQLVGVIDVKR